MNQRELAGVVAAATGMTIIEIEKVLNSAKNVIELRLARGEEIRLSGLGVFKTVHRKATQARNPQNGALIEVPARRAPKFQPSKTLKDAVAG